VCVVRMRSLLRFMACYFQSVATQLGPPAAA